jgi:signal transduction histidine kinase/ActR/RegA family two-component response regulator
MGTGIWSMHFVGMLALSLPVPISYDVVITLFSMLIAIVVSTFALHIASGPTLAPVRLVGGGVAMGIGICSMHYVGMSAIEIEPSIQYNLYWVAVSVLIAIAASFAALGLVFKTPASNDGWSAYRRPLGGVAMGIAIAGMHYAGMAAAHFPVAAEGQLGGVLAGSNTGWLAGTVTTVSVFILLSTMLIAFLDARAAAGRVRMQASLAEARQSNRAKDDFLAMLAHELRNPLAAIMNAGFLLRVAGPNSREWTFAHDVIERQSSHLKRIVDDLLDVGRAISGKMALDTRPVELVATVESALRMLATGGKVRDQQIDWQGTRVWVEGDSTRLQQVVSNIVANAAEHSRPDDVIEVRLTRQGGAAVLTVRDHGVGLDPATASRVFDLFYQAHQDVHRGKGGLGIGLTLVRRIVEMHHGEVDVASDGLGKGALFTVRLPAIAMPATERPSKAFKTAASRRVLVIEDAEDTRRTLRMALELHGHDVCTAADGVKGLDALLAIQPDIALIDIGLPQLDGYEIARRARSAGVRARLVALTGYGMPQDEALATQAGFDVHITKPANLDYVLSLVSDAPNAMPLREAR